jgi:putative tryptophan/tyrosine transport system substrate-binding protein
MLVGGTNRREFIAGLGGAAAWPVVALAQQTGPMRRIGVLMNRAANDPEGLDRLAAFRQALQQLDWSDGRNVRKTRAGARTMSTASAKPRRN